MNMPVRYNPFLSSQISGCILVYYIMVRVIGSPVPTPVANREAKFLSQGRRPSLWNTPLKLSILLIQALNYQEPQIKLQHLHTITISRIV